MRRWEKSGPAFYPHRAAEPGYGAGVAEPEVARDVQEERGGQENQDHEKRVGSLFLFHARIVPGAENAPPGLRARASLLWVSATRPPGQQLASVVVLAPSIAPSTSAAADQESRGCT